MILSSEISMETEHLISDCSYEMHTKKKEKDEGWIFKYYKTFTL